MGRVWRATDVVLHREVAIKELVPPPGLTPGERQEMRERSLREARAIARLNNINVVRVFDVLSTDADPWIVMEYVPSRSLQDILAADGPFSPVRTAEIGLGVLGALRAAHRAGVVHRDVKPGNVLIGGDGRVVLTDFGLATVPGDPNVTRTGLVLGSPAYIAPERARDGTAGPAADLWSLGATLYAAVEGASPFARPSAIATLAALATENPPPARNAGPMKPVLNGLLRKDPTHRINAEEAERLLNRALGRRSKLSFPMSPTMRRPGVGRERPALGGMMSSTSSAPVVPGPRPPVAPARPVDPPGRPPVSGGRPAAGEGRPPIFAPGKAPVGRPTADTPKLDATRIDTPPVKDDKTTFMGTRDGSPNAGTRPPASRQPSPAPTPANPSNRTNRGEPGGFTAADVAAHRRGPAAAEHEQSLTDATALVRGPVTPPRRPAAPPADATALVRGPATPPADATALVRGPATPPADATSLVRGPAAPPADRTTVVPPAPADATTRVAPPADPTTVVPPTKLSPKRKPSAKSRPAAKTTPATPERVNPEANSAAAAGAGATLADAESARADAAVADAMTSRASAAHAESSQVDAALTHAESSQAGAAVADAETSQAGAGVADPETSQGGAALADTESSQAGAAVADVETSRAGAGSADAETSSADAAVADAKTSNAVAGVETPQAESSSANTSPNKSGKSEKAAGSTDQTATADQVAADKAGTEEVTAAKANAGEANAASAKAGAAGAGAAGPGAAGAGVKKKAAAAAQPDETPAAAHVPLARTGSSATPGTGKKSAGEKQSTADEDNAPVSPVPSISRSTRPAWRPMESRPAPGGVTVFGTRLTYRQAAVGAGIVLLVLALLITLIAQAVGGGDDKGDGTKPNAVGPTAATTPATTPPTAAASTTPSAAPSSAAPTTTAPTSAPATEDPGTAALPAGWTLRTFAASGGAPAFKLPLPANAEVSGSGTEMRMRWNNRLLILGRTKSPQADAYTDWQNQEKARRGTYRNYNLIGLKRVTNYRDFESVADWEFTYTTDSGNPQHVLRRNIRVNGSAAYSLNWYVSTSDWDASQGDLKALYQGFQPQ
ncbi:hypothetical protein Ate02nite_71950 [Paractinoplanes tereljensis]|uniref:Protein kinase domain-containing protein n=1 Tax=Paractinoplanes tereljensis TaxID=571912 RepID=A0A919NUG4_9ACTN|nr:hypothetical protein Ate02nite_71950 [Actinoplanes tereljensis]